MHNIKILGTTNLASVVASRLNAQKDDFPFPESHIEWKRSDPIIDNIESELRPIADHMYNMFGLSHSYFNANWNIIFGNIIKTSNDKVTVDLPESEVQYTFNYKDVYNETIATLKNDEIISNVLDTHEWIIDPRDTIEDEQKNFIHDIVDKVAVTSYTLNEKLQYNETIFMEHGFIRITPFNEVANVSYYYNSSISTENEVNEDLKKYFDKVSLNDIFHSINNFYYTKTIIKDNTVYLGKNYCNLEGSILPLQETAYYDTIHAYTSLIINTIKPHNYIKYRTNELKEYIDMYYFFFLLGHQESSKFWKTTVKTASDFLIKRAEENIEFKLLIRRLISLYYMEDIKIPHGHSYAGQSGINLINLIVKFNLKDFLLNMYRKEDVCGIPG